MLATLRPFCIGNVRIAGSVVLAPLAGYSDLAYRLICRRLGSPYCSTEMLLDKSVLIGGKLQRRLLRITEEDHPIAGQLIGNDPRAMAAAAEVLCRDGFDVIDLNFACPVNKALKRKRGGYLMSEPEKALAVTAAVLDAVDRPVTLKLRRRFREDESDRAFWRIAEGAFEAGAAAITAHARSVERKYSGPADWAFLAAVKERFADRTVLGSGDVLTPAAALELLDRTGVDAVIVARGAMGNPWFFRQVQDVAAGRQPYRPPLAEQRSILEWHFDKACDLYGPVRGPKMMRKFGIKYGRMHPTPRLVRPAFVDVRNPADWQAVLAKFYSGE